MPKNPPAAESDGEDDDLLLAASAWASAQGESSGDDGSGSETPAQKPKIREPDGNWNSVKSAAKEHHKTAASSAGDQAAAKKPQHAGPPPQNYSLHLTKVPYEATQTDIRCAFGERGCHLTSVRLVYDRDQKTGERHFRGVAFVDFADERSYQKGLELDRTKFLGKGRRVNVRPTRTKRELSEIVKRTEEKVANLIARSKEKAQSKKRERDDDDGDGGGAADAQEDSKRGKNERKKKKRKRSDERSKKKSADVASSGKHVASAKQPKGNDAKKSPGKESKPHSKSKGEHRAKPKANEDGSPMKLTKKQRAKKAAVIRMMKLKGKKRN
ncbi:hypothetical protein ACHAXT_010186 [Thalassiosira profunda]